MAVSVKTVLFQGQNLYIADLVAAAEGDVAELLVTHGISTVPGTVAVPGVPLMAWVVPMIATTAASNPAWAITTAPNATQVGVTKSLGGAGSAGGVPGTTVIGRLFVMRPHSNIG
jgi:hypothetical protein